MVKASHITSADIPHLAGFDIYQGEPTTKKKPLELTNGW